MELNQEDIERINQEIIVMLHTVYDPEIPVNVYELGLIYDIVIEKDGTVRIIMTLTSPNCPMIEMLPDEIKEKIESIKGVEKCQVEITFDPPWDMSMMSEEARLELGFL